MKSIYPEQPRPLIPRTALSPAEAAASIGMSRRFLDDNLDPKGLRIPNFRIGSRVFIPISLLESWMAEQAGSQGTLPPDFVEVQP